MSFEQGMNWEVPTRVGGWLLAFACAVLLVRIGIVLVDGVEVGFEPIPLSISAQTDRPALVSDWSMFGQPTDVDYGFAEVVPATPLALRLRGVVTGERGYAIIMDAEGREGVYRVDDPVPGGASVIA
ncbi:MAG: hypothetical protein LC637_14655, partial [Xanthomonadaceae bacterium]|nr:hypothetical protein [Xanthomonadaceae bacterium]